MTRHHPFAPRLGSHRGTVMLAAGAIFAVGFVVGATVRSPPAPQRVAAVESALAAVREPALAAVRETPPDAGSDSPRLEPRLVYPADVVRVIDGDTFEARVRVWPGLAVETKVRLRGIDAPEMHARCADEHVKAEAARAALEGLLAEGGVAISRVGLDKYG